MFKNNSVSIPLKSGHIVIEEFYSIAIDTSVSIPLKSGHIVIYRTEIESKYTGFNPLKIGSYCNSKQ